METARAVAWKVSRGETSQEAAVFFLSVVVRALPQHSEGDHWVISYFNNVLWQECQKTIKGASDYRSLKVGSREVAEMSSRENES